MKFKALVISALLACAGSLLGPSSLPAFSKGEKLSDLAPGLYGYQDPNTGRHRKYYVPDPKYPEQLISDLKEQPLPEEYLDLVVGKRKDDDDPDRAAIDALLGKKKKKESAPKVEKKPEKPAPDQSMEMSDRAPMEMSDQAPMEMPEAKGEPPVVPKKAPAKAKKKTNFDEPASVEGAADDQPLLNSTKEPSMNSLMKPDKKASKKTSKPAKESGAEQSEDGFEQPKNVAADNEGSETERPEKVKKDKVKAEKVKPEKVKPEKIKADKAKADQGENFEGTEAAESAEQAKKLEKAEKVKKVKPERPPKEKPSKEKAPAVADDTGSGDGISDKIFSAPFAAGGKAGKFFGTGLKKTGKPFGKIHGFFFGPSDK